MKHTHTESLVLSKLPINARSIIRKHIYNASQVSPATQRWSLEMAGGGREGRCSPETTELVCLFSKHRELFGSEAAPLHFRHRFRVVEIKVLCHKLTRHPQDSSLRARTRDRQAPSEFRGD